MRSPKPWAPTLWAVLWCLTLVWLDINAHTALALALAFGSAALLPEEIQAAIERLFREVVADLGLCNAAQIIGMDCSDLRRALKGEGSRRLGLHHIERLPLENKRAFYFGRVVDLGLPLKAKRTLRMTLDALTSEEGAA